MLVETNKADVFFVSELTTQMPVCATMQSFFAKHLSNTVPAKLATRRMSHKQLFNCNILARFIIQF